MYILFRFALSQNDYSDLDHAATKKLYFQLASVLVPDNVGFFLKNGNLVIEHEYYSEQYQRNNTVTRFISKVKQYRHSKTEENLFFSARAKAAQMILSHLPRTTTLADPRQFCMSQVAAQQNIGESHKILCRSWCSVRPPSPCW